MSKKKLIIQPLEVIQTMEDLTNVVERIEDWVGKDQALDACSDDLMKELQRQCILRSRDLLQTAARLYSMIRAAEAKSAIARIESEKD